MDASDRTQVIATFPFSGSTMQGSFRLKEGGDGSEIELRLGPDVFFFRDEQEMFDTFGDENIDIEVIR